MNVSLKLKGVTPKNKRLNEHSLDVSPPGEKSARKRRAAAINADKKIDRIYEDGIEEAKKRAITDVEERKQAAASAKAAAREAARQEAEAAEKEKLRHFRDHCVNHCVDSERADEIFTWLTNAENYSLPYARKPLKDYTEILQSNVTAENMVFELQKTNMEKMAGENELANSELEDLANTTFIEASKEGHNTIMKSGNPPASSIADDCIKNWDENSDKICYCCGNMMSPNHKDHQCDHFIPVVQMLACIHPGYCGKNLHYICSGCNGKKSNTSLLHLWHNCGTNFYPRSLDTTALATTTTMAPPDSTPQSRAREKIKEILKSLRFNKTADKNLLHSIINNNKLKVTELFDDIKRSFKFEHHAQLLINFSNTAARVASLIQENSNPPQMRRKNTSNEVLMALNSMAEKFIYGTKNPPYMPSFSAARFLYINKKYIENLDFQMRQNLEWAGISMLFDNEGRLLFDADSATVYDYKGDGNFDIKPENLTEEQKGFFEIPSPRQGGKFIKHTKTRKSKRRKQTKRPTKKIPKKRRPTKIRKPTKTRNPKKKPKKKQTKKRR